MISSNRIQFTDETYKGLINENVESAMLAKNLQVLYSGESNAIKTYLLTGDEAYISQYDDYLLKANKTIKEMLNTYQAERDIEIINELAAFRLRYDEIIRKEINMKKAGNVIGYTNLMNTSGKTISNVFQRKIDDLNMRTRIISILGIEEATKSVAQTKSFVLILGIFSVLAGLIISIILSRSISKPVKVASEALQQVATGNLQIKSIPIKSKDEVGDLAVSYNKMIEDLRYSIGTNSRILFKCCF